MKNRNPNYESCSTSILVIKCGGSIVNNQVELNSLIADIQQLQKSGYSIVVVHGGGPDINQLCQKLNISSEFIDGLRVTSTEILAVTQMALLGKTNAILAQQFNQAGILALGLSGHDVKLLQGEFVNQNKLGFVGEITDVNHSFLTQLLAMGITPLIAPLAIKQDITLNINADLAAAAIAISLQAEKLILLSDIDGYYTNYPDPTSLLAQMDSLYATQLLAAGGIVNSGMRPKLSACVQAVEAGVKTAHILNGNTPHLLIELLQHKQTVGTTVSKEQLS